MQLYCKLGKHALMVFIFLLIVDTLTFVCFFHAAQENHSDSRFPEQKEPSPEDQTNGAEAAGAGVLPPGSKFLLSKRYGMIKRDHSKRAMISNKDPLTYIDKCSTLNVWLLSVVQDIIYQNEDVPQVLLDFLHLKHFHTVNKMNSME